MQIGHVCLPGGNGLTPYPYLFMYPQNKNERTLLAELTKNAVPVYWDTTLTSFTQNNAAVEAIITANGAAIKITADYLIGADGTHSAVRHILGIHFNGDTSTQLFYLADVVTDKNEDYIDLHLGDDGFLSLLPKPEKNSYRIVGSLPAKLKDAVDITIDDILPLVQKIKGSAISVKEVNWITTYRLSHRMADKFSAGRCFLIGDAAHIHSPLGGQGMNTGLQDAYNLAWKLAGVVTGKLYPRILKSYANERIPVARKLLRTTDRAFNVLMSRSWASRLFKKLVLPGALSFAQKNDKFKLGFFRQISQIGINYRHSPINLHLSQATHIKAGDRLPYLTLYDEKKQVYTDLHAWCTKPGFTMIIMGRLTELELLSFARFITHFYGAGLNFFYLPASEKNQHIFDAFEIRNGHIKTLVVRPDNYIGFMCDSTDIDIINNYLGNTAGLIRQTIN